MDQASMKDYLAVSVISILLGLALAWASQVATAASGVAAEAGTASVDSLTDTGNLSQGVAASVNGVDIGEAAITAYIENFRALLGLTDGDVWAEWLAENGYTPDQIRAETVEVYVSQEELRQAAVEVGVEVSKAEIDEAVKEDADSYSSEDAWRDSLAQRGITESFNRTVVESALLQRKLAEEAAAGGADDEMVLAYARAYAGTWEGDVPEIIDSLEDVPDDLLQLARESADLATRQSNLAAWMQEWALQANIVRYPMPEGLPYDVD